MVFWMLLIAAIIGLAWAAYATRDDAYIGVLPVAFCAGLVLGLGTLFSYLIVQTSDIAPTRTEAWFVELVSLRNTEGIQGSFFLASGWIGNTEHYIYMYRTKNGDLRRGRQNAYNCTIRETNSQSPRRVYDKRWVEVSWLFPWEIQLKDSMPAFVVPPGTVISLDQYEID